jgi:hypothetical protein
MPQKPEPKKNIKKIFGYARFCDEKRLLMPQKFKGKKRKKPTKCK